MADENNSSVTLKEVIEEDIFNLIGLDSVSDEEKMGLYKKILETVRFRVFCRFDESLKDNEREEFKKVLYEGDDEKLKDFYKSKNFDFDTVMIEEALRYKIELTTYVDFVKKSGSSIEELKEKIAKDEL